MKIVIAPDSFKGSLSALKAAQSVALGLARVWPEAELVLFPIADGGEGTVETLVALTNGTLYEDEALDPLGRPVKAIYGFLGDGRTAVVETASASGLTRLAPEELDPTKASTYGLGQQILQVIERGAEKLIVGLGGSGTNDAGSGMLKALGLKLLDKDGRELPPGGLPLRELDRIDPSGLRPELARLPIAVASDVQNPLVGPDGASAVFGPQKGATPELVPQLDGALGRFAECAEKVTGRNVLTSPGSGAAGGLGAAFRLFTNAEFRPGVELILAEGRFREKAQGASLIVTGEGRSDGQTVWGKAPVGVSALGAELGVPVVCLSGGLAEGYQKMYDKNILAVMSVIPRPMTLAEAMSDAEPLLVEAAERLARLINVQMK
ncbi:MAG: glycerate kinase [Deltaproteobacteria bacterium]|nr:glycerate kinase [Deltaproteobacteria bacterium]